MQFKRMFKSLISMTLCTVITLSTTASFASVLGDAKIDGYTRQIGEGTYFTHNTFFSNQTGVGQQSENYITYTPNSTVIPSITYGTKLYGASTLSTETSRLEGLGQDVIGGTNADFFSFQTGVPMSNAIIDGKIVTKDASNQESIGIMEDGTAFISKAIFYSILTKADGSEVQIYNINKYRQPYAAYMLTNEFSDTTRNTTKGYDIVLGSIEGEMKIGTKMTAVVESVTVNSSSIAIPKDKIVITIDAKAPEEFLKPLSTLKVGEKVSIRYTAIGDSRWKDVKIGMGALGGRLLSNGEVTPNLEPGAAPRTAIGITANGSIILYTIDGRQTGHSYGVQLKTLAQRMKELGCVDALNLDGGGSTTITAQLPGNHYSTMKNKPSDGKQRNVSTYFYFINTAKKTGNPAHLHIYPNSSYVLKNSELKLSLMATDAGFFPVDVPKDVTFSVEDGKASTVTNDGVFTAKDNGLVTVYAQSGDSKGSIGINCLETPTELTVMNKSTGKKVTSLAFNPGEKITLTADAFGGYNKLIETDDSFTWEADPEIGTFNKNTFTASNNYGTKGNIRVSAGKKTVSIPVTIASINNTYYDAYPIIDMKFENGILTGKITCKYPIDTYLSGLTLLADGIEREFVFDPDTNKFTAELKDDVHKITVHAKNRYGYTTVKSITVDSNLSKPPFVDTKNHWAEDILGYMYSQAIINGDPTDGTLKFYPQKQMTRSEFAVMMVNYLGVDPEEYADIKLPYTDLKEIPIWALNSFKALYALDILKGRYVTDTESCADPMTSISRAEAATIVARTLPAGIYKAKINATDKDDVASWATDGFAVLIQIGAMKGYEDGSLKPKAPLTKAEAAKILYSAM